MDINLIWKNYNNIFYRNNNCLKILIVFHLYRVIKFVSIPHQIFLNIQRTFKLLKSKNILKTLNCLLKTTSTSKCLLREIERKKYLKWKDKENLEPLLIFRIERKKIVNKMKYNINKLLKQKEKEKLRILLNFPL